MVTDSQQKEIEHRLWTEFPLGLTWWKIHLTYERVLKKEDNLIRESSLKSRTKENITKTN
ncbi:hypothetical protein [Lutibacter sp.]|uniref:hypothetical protein n=1 Tax=Lutibacter sp. TaxID=1925666 RepID=UPI0034A07FB1